MTDPKSIWINLNAPWDGTINPVHGAGDLSHYVRADLGSAAQAAAIREAALMDARASILALDTQRDEDTTYNLAVLRAAEKVRNLILEGREHNKVKAELSESHE